VGDERGGRQTGASTLERCAREDVHAEPTLPPGVGGVNVQLRFWNRGDARCWALLRVRLTLETEAGDPLGVEANGERVLLDRPLSASESRFARWHWFNWCGGKDDLFLALTGDVEQRLPIQPPPCDDPSESSILDRLALKEELQISG
jgi:hypothetical protein